MTNDLTTLNGALTELGETMADNLVAMGVTSADASDGLTTLAGKILDIEPSVSGLDLTSEMSLTTSTNSITLGQSVVLTAVLTANYDDETLVNVDLHGYLQGATVSFKIGNTVIGTGVTDANGVASYTYTPSSTGTLSLTGVFAGTDNFSDATSNSVSVSVVSPTPDSISLTADKNVLSYYDSESATLSATVLDANSNPLEDVTVEFFKGSTSLGTADTNSSGVATKSYVSTGVGDVSFTASVSGGSLVSETYSIQDCLLYDVTGFSKTTSTSTDTTYDSGYAYSLASISDFEMEFDFNNPIGFRLYFSNVNVTSTGQDIQYGVGFGRNASNKFIFTERTTTTSNTTCQTIANATNHYKIKFNGNAVNVWVNDVQQVSNKTLSWWGSHFPYYFDWAIWATGTGTVNNIKIKAL